MWFLLFTCTEVVEKRRYRRTGGKVKEGKMKKKTFIKREGRKGEEGRRERD